MSVNSIIVLGEDADWAASKLENTDGVEVITLILLPDRPTLKYRIFYRHDGGQAQYDTRNYIERNQILEEYA